MSSLTLAWIAEIIAISYRSAKRASVGKNPIVSPLAPLPLPSEYVATFIIYGALSFVPGRGQQAAGLFGWGIVIATVLNLWDPSTIGNKGGPAVKGGPSTKTKSGAPAVSPNAPVGS